MMFKDGKYRFKTKDIELLVIAENGRVYMSSTKRVPLVVRLDDILNADNWEEVTCQ